MEEYKLSKDRLAFNIIPIVLRDSKYGISLHQYVNSVTITNYGSSIITINSTIVLYPGTPGSIIGDSISFGGNKGELFKGTIDVSFNASAGNNCLILQKVYFPDFF